MEEAEEQGVLAALARAVPEAAVSLPRLQHPAAVLRLHAWEDEGPAELERVLRWSSLVVPGVSAAVMVFAVAVAVAADEFELLCPVVHPVTRVLQRGLVG